MAMFNILLDQLPNDYNGYLIRTDFRVAIQILTALNDSELLPYEQVGTALDLLYGKGVPPIEEAINGLKWFLYLGKDEEQENYTDIDPCVDYNIDSQLVYSAFKKAGYGDLKVKKMHWWEFITLTGDLGECAFNSVAQIRSKEITAEMSEGERNYYIKAKKEFALKSTFTEDQETKISEFMNQLKGCEERVDK